MLRGTTTSSIISKYVSCKEGLQIRKSRRYILTEGGNGKSNGRAEKKKNSIYN